MQVCIARLQACGLRDTTRPLLLFVLTYRPIPREDQKTDDPLKPLTRLHKTLTARRASLAGPLINITARLQTLAGQLHSPADALHTLAVAVTF